MKVILPGSYDPVTLGHLEIIREAAAKYSEAYAVIFINPEKKYLFSSEERLEMLRLATEEIENVRVDFYSGRVVDYMKEKKIEKIVKGYRNEEDAAYEKVQSDYNFSHGGYHTELIKSSDELSHVSSTLARERLLKGESLDEILPESVVKYILNKKSFI